MPKVWNKRDKNCPKDAVYVGRPSPWGNPFPITATQSRDVVIEKFRRYAIVVNQREPEWLKPLRGKDLVCWCAPSRCHADVLLELANSSITGENL